MRNFFLFFSLTIIFSVKDCYTEIYNVKNFGRAVSEARVIKKEKDTQAMMLGKNKTSKGLQALRASDLSKVIKKARKKMYEKNKEESVLNNTEIFVVARVADDVITNVDIINAIRFVFFASQQPFDKKFARMMVKPVLNSLIDDKIRQSIARSQDMNIDDEVNEKIEKIAKNNNLTREELDDAFKKNGIDMTIFKNNISAKMIFSSFYQSVKQSITLDATTIKNYKDKYLKDAKHERYKLSEIFFKVKNLQEKQLVKENAEAIFDLLEQGFDFSALVDSVSQAEALNRATENEWIISENMDSAVRIAVKNLKPGQHSAVIEVPGGYKIVKVIDKAMPNKEGTSKTKFRVIVAEVPTPTPTTEEEAISLQMRVNTISEANSVEQFRRTCEVYEFKHMETTIVEPDFIQTELINRHKATGCSGIVRISKEQPMVALFIISEEIPDATAPDDNIISDVVVNRKTAQEFAKIMKRQRAMNYETIYKNSLENVVID